MYRLSSIPLDTTQFIHRICVDHKEMRDLLDKTDIKIVPTLYIMSNNAIFEGLNAFNWLNRFAEKIDSQNQQLQQQQNQQLQQPQNQQQNQQLQQPQNQQLQQPQNQQQNQQ